MVHQRLEPGGLVEHDARAQQVSACARVCVGCVCWSKSTRAAPPYAALERAGWGLVLRGLHPASRAQQGRARWRGPCMLRSQNSLPAAACPPPPSPVSLAPSRDTACVARSFFLIVCYRCRLQAPPVYRPPVCGMCWTPNLSHLTPLPLPFTPALPHPHRYCTPNSFDLAQCAAAFPASYTVTLWTHSWEAPPWVKAEPAAEQQQQGEEGEIGRQERGEVEEMNGLQQARRRRRRRQWRRRWRRR